MPEQRTAMRNIRPPSRRLPVVDAEKADCPACDGSGEDWVSCTQCDGSGATSLGHVCGECKGKGQVWDDCPACDGSGQVGGL